MYHFNNRKQAKYLIKLKLFTNHFPKIKRLFCFNSSVHLAFWRVRLVLVLVYNNVPPTRNINTTNQTPVYHFLSPTYFFSSLLVYSGILRLSGLLQLSCLLLYFAEQITAYWQHFPLVLRLLRLAILHSSFPRQMNPCREFKEPLLRKTVSSSSKWIQYE